MARLKTIKRFEEWKQVPENLDRFFGLLEGADGKVPLRFRDACVAVGMPYMLMYSFVRADATAWARYEAVGKAMADAMMHETVQIADAVKPDRDEVARARLQIESRQAFATKLDRERYGDQVQVRDVTAPGADAELLSAAGDLLRLIVNRERSADTRVVEGEVVPAPALTVRPE